MCVVWTTISGFDKFCQVLHRLSILCADRHCVCWYILAKYRGLGERQRIEIFFGLKYVLRELLHCCRTDACSAFRLHNAVVSEQHVQISKCIALQMCAGQMCVFMLQC